MPSFGGGDILSAAAVATVVVDVTVHPMDTIITRIQSPTYRTHYRQLNGLFHPSLFRGLYQGFGPTLIAGIPSSAAFFAIYEASKSLFENAQKSGHLQFVPLPIAHAISGAAADLMACAIINPAEVLKQNAQVSRQRSTSPGQRSHLMQALKTFSRQPTRLWTGYTMLVASSLPGTSLTFSLYEWLKKRLTAGDSGLARDIQYQAKVSAVSAAVAAGCASCIFVPVDVVKTRMRLAAGGNTPASSSAKTVVQGPMATAKNILRTEGVTGLFRGLTFTFLASMFGAGLYLGCYEGCKLYMAGDGGSDKKLSG
ncbi:mitochondrial carrier domain-containing protein [Trichoderma sp. SZMC 28012]